jgi:hypothetical protein
MERLYSRYLAVLGVLLLGWLLAVPTRSAAQGTERIGTVLAVDGVAEVRTRDATEWERLKFRDAIFLNDTVRTAAESKLKVLLHDDSIMTLAERSEMRFTDALLTEQQRRTVVSLLVGKVRVLITRLFGTGSTTEVHTPNAVAGVRGSEGHVSYVAETQQTNVLPGSGDWYMRDPVVPTRILDIPVGRAADQVGAPGVPAATREATAGERQAAVQGTQVTEQVKGEVQTTTEARQEQAQGLSGPERGGPPGGTQPGPLPSTRIETGPIQQTAVAPLPGVIPTAVFDPTTGGRPGPLADNPQLTQVTPGCPGCPPVITEFIQTQNARVQLTITIPR